MSDTAPHMLSVVRDEFGDLDSVSIICPGVTPSCETWWECQTCMDATPEQREEWEDDMWENEEAHGVEHQHLEFGWGVRGTTPRCIGHTMDDGGNYADAAEGLPTGDYPCDLRGDEEYVQVKLIGLSR